MQTFTTAFVALFAASAMAAAMPEELEKRQTFENTAQVTVCNGYNQNEQQCGGTGNTCNTVTLNVGTYADTDGTVCWFLPGNPHPDPTSISNIQFCNGAAGRGTCHLSSECHVAPDGSCDASGTQSMGLTPS